MFPGNPNHDLGIANIMFFYLKKNRNHLLARHSNPSIRVPDLVALVQDDVMPVVLLDVVLHNAYV